MAIWLALAASVVIYIAGSFMLLCWMGGDEQDN